MPERTGRLGKLLSSLAAGGASAIVAAVVVISLLLLAGIIDRPPLWVLGSGPLAAGAIGRLGLRSDVAFRVGVILAAGGILTVDMLASATRPGWLAIATAAGSLAPLALQGRMVERARGEWRWPSVLLAVLLVLAFVRIVVGGGELGHDESAYALKARGWLEGTPETGWDLHRGVGQSVLAAGVLLFTDDPIALRTLSVVLTLATVGAVWHLGRTVRTNRVGIMSASVFAVAPSFLRRGAEFLTDVPSTGLLLVAAALVWKWCSDEEDGRRHILWATVAGSIAIYIRYQAVLSLGLLVVAALLVARGRFRRRLGDIAIAAGLGLVLLTPHFVQAIRATGVPWGILTETGSAGGREFLGEGLVDYARLFPDLLAGWLGAIAVVFALAWIGWATTGRSESKSLAIFLGVPALGQFLALGLISHGEPRFVFFPVALLAVAAASAVADWAPILERRRILSGLLGFGLMLALVSLAVNADRADRQAEARADSYVALVEAARFAAEASDGECGILTGLLPQITWYSGCETARYGSEDYSVDLDPRLDRYFLLSELGPRQPKGQLLDDYLANGEEVFSAEGSGSTGDVELHRIED